MAPTSSTTVATLSTSSNRGPRASYLAAAFGAAAASLTLWLVWRRRPRVTREEAFAALHRLRHECAAAYADVLATITSVGLPEDIAKALVSASKTEISKGANASTSGEDDSSIGAGDDKSPKKEDPATKIRQAIEQPLVLEAVIGRASTRAAAALFPGAKPRDLETELRLRASESIISEGTNAIRAMHGECLRGVCKESPSSEEALKLWGPEEALKMLRELGRSKAGRLQDHLGKSGGDGQHNASVALGALRACAEGEEELWCRRWPSREARDSRRRCFRTALARLSALDAGFRARREKVERELEGLAHVAASACPVRCA
eukprot:TRINITY_DN56865_c0_g1_i1.p1 TRINITY_DN56865_c0_g1~~TRINITY_DN56865_c0_g1_i1.p1  ORF type:complete len:345 (-),score=48.02 TRINITY_DN56865_c0_g1_i1:280-1239(-)